MAKNKIPDKTLTELNRQFNCELNAAHAYLALSLWCGNRSLRGFANFFAKQAGEEREHAGKIIQHVQDRGGVPELTAVPAPKCDFKNLLQVVEQAQAMEQSNTKGINAVFAAALADKDYPAQVLMHWFINEQVEEEAWAGELLARVQAASCAGSLLDLDRHVEKLLADNGKED